MVGRWTEYCARCGEEIREDEEGVQAVYELGSKVFCTKDCADSFKREVVSMAEEKEKYIEVGLEELKEGWNPRQTFEDLDILARDIEARGLLSRLEVRPLEDGGYEIIDGARRFRAVQELGWEKVPCLVLDVDEEEAAAMKFARFEYGEGITEHDRLVALAERWAIERKRAKGLTQETFAARYGVARSTVANALRYVEAPKEVLELVERGELTPSHIVQAVLKLEDPEEQVEFAQAFVDRRYGYGGGSVEAAVKMADGILREREAAREFEELREKAGVKLCPKCGHPPRALSIIESAHKVEDLDVVKVGKAQVLVCSAGRSWRAHRWNPTTGDLLYDKWDAQAIQRRVRVARERGEKAAKKRKAKAAGKALLEPAWFFSRVTLGEWATHLLGVSIDQLDVLDNQGTNRGGKLEAKLRECGLPYAIRFEAVDLDDGREPNGIFRTRILLQGFRSGRQEDNVAVGDYVQPVRSRRKQVLKFQRETIGADQADDDYMVQEAGGLKVGQFVRLRDDRKSYGGKTAIIVAFDTWGPNVFQKDPGKVQYALLDLSLPQKLFPLDRLEVVSQETSKAG